MNTPAKRLRLFHNALRILINIDRHDLVGAGVGGHHWPAFRKDPYRWFIAATDADAERVWLLIESRQPGALKAPE